MMYSMIPFGRYHGGLDTIFDDLERSFFPPANRQPTAFRTDIRDEGDHFLLEAELRASYENGVLTLILPKMAEIQPQSRRIAIQ